MGTRKKANCGECLYGCELKIFKDKEVPVDMLNTPGYATATLPEALEIKESDIHGLGVFSRSTIPKGARFGPYKGKRLQTVDDHPSNYIWTVKKPGGLIHYIDGKDTSHSNWMRYVNCSRYEEEQNLQAYQLRGGIYYRAYKEIPHGKELLVWYGQQCGEELGLSTATLDDDHKEEASQCTKCGKLFTCSHVRERHFKYRCSAFLPKQCCFKCPLCNKEAATPKAATKHLRTHATARKNKCPLCDKPFSHSGHLVVHLRTHTGEKSFQCTRCQKAFPTHCGLTTHLRSHTGEKPFQCAHCGKAFSCHGNLIVHLRTHTGEKPFRCSHCDRAFSCSGNRTRHLRTHTGEQPFQCTQCHMKFSYSGVLITHLRSHR